MNIKLIVMVSTVATLTACGGGGSSDSTTTTPTTTTPTTTTPTTTTPTTTTPTTTTPTTTTPTTTTPTTTTPTTTTPTHYVYITSNNPKTNDPDTILTYAIGANGTLSAVSTPALITGVKVFPDDITSVLLHPAGKYAYALSGGTLYEYTIGANGVLSPMSTPTILATNQPPATAVIDPAGTYIYVVNKETNQVGFIHNFSISTNGILVGNANNGIAPAGTGSGGVPSLSTSSGLFINNDPTGNLYYTMPSQSGSNGTLFKTPANNPNGSFTSVAIPTGTLDRLTGTTIAPNGKYLYITGGATGAIYVYGIGASVTPSLNSIAYLTGYGTLTGSQGFAIDPTSKYAYILSYQMGVGGRLDGFINEYSIGLGGSLTPLSTATIPTTTNPQSIAVDSTGKYVYVGDLSGNVSTYSIGVNGVLSAIGSPISVSIFNIAHITVN